MADNEYAYFLEALRWNVSNKWKRQQGALASDSGISDGFFSEIVHEKKNAGFETQVAISKACGYEDLVSFLDFGKRLLLCKPSQGTKRIGTGVGVGWSGVPETHMKSSGINQNSNIDAKVGSGMDANEKDAILRHCLEELAALREEIKYLREERNHFRDRVMAFEKQLKPDPEEKKTAV